MLTAIGIVNITSGQTMPLRYSFRLKALNSKYVTMKTFNTR